MSADTYDTTKLLPGGFYFTNQRIAVTTQTNGTAKTKSKRVYRELLSGAPFYLSAGQRNYPLAQTTPTEADEPSSGVNWCPSCDGTGYDQDASEVCFLCGGSGT